MFFSLLGSEEHPWGDKLVMRHFRRVMGRNQRDLKIVVFELICFYSMQEYLLDFLQYTSTGTSEYLDYL